MDTGLLYVQAAQRLSLHPIVLLADSSQYDCFATEGSEAIRVDTNDLDALICECSRIRATYEIAGITSTDESLYATVGKLCRHFRLLGPNRELIERCCDKFAQRQLLAQAGVPIPAYRVVANAANVERAAAERRSSPRILVEEFALGPRDTVHIMGNELIGFTAAEFGPPPYFVHREFIFPASLTDDEHERIANVSLSCLRAPGLHVFAPQFYVRWPPAQTASCWRA